MIASIKHCSDYINHIGTWFWIISYGNVNMCSEFVRKTVVCRFSIEGFHCIVLYQNCRVTFFASFFEEKVNGWKLLSLSNH